MIVIDASALLEWLLDTHKGQAIGHRLQADATPVAPHLVDLEIAQALRRYAASDQVPSRRALDALEDYSNLRLRRYPHFPLLARVWELRQNASAYDAVYIALAEALNAPLVTCDRAMAQIRHHATIETF